MSGALGGIADRFPRRRLVVTLELAACRNACGARLGWTIPSVWLIVPVLFVLAMINAIVQPARQAAVPGLVPVGQVGRANAMVAAAGTLAGAAGFGLGRLDPCPDVPVQRNESPLSDRCGDVRDCRLDHARHTEPWRRDHGDAFDRGAAASVVHRRRSAASGDRHVGCVSSCR